MYKKANGNNFLQVLNHRDDDIPKAVLYNASFFSFYKNKSTVEKSRENRKGEILRFNIFICLILEGTSNQRLIRNQIKIDKEISYYESDYSSRFLVLRLKTL